MTGSSKPPAAVAAVPRLHVVTDDRIFAEPGFTDAAARIMQTGGGDVALHLRAPGASGAAMYDAAVELSRIASASGAVLLVNDRVDVAAAVGAGGVQLPGHGLPADAARRVLGPGVLIGASVHSLNEAAAVPSGMDFLLVGTVFGSASHPGRTGSGVSLIRELSSVGLPIVAIGGITPRHVPDVVAAGAHGVAAIGAIWHADDATTAVRRFLEML